MAGKNILDVCCGGKMFYFDKADERVMFCDKRTLAEMELCDGRKFEVKPDMVCDFAALPFEDNTYPLVVFDPPHLKEINENAYMAIKYGRLEGDWKETLRRGFSECFRVLKPYGTLVFKWCENQIPLNEILELTDKRPVFGSRSGKRSQTLWVVFFKEGG